MRWILPLAIAGSLRCLASAEVLDLGDLEQYNPQLTAVPGDTEANGIWIGQGNGGYHVALGQDVKGKVQGVLEGCGQTDDHCYQEINKVFNSADVQIDQQLDRRGFVALLSKTFKKKGIFFLVTSAILEFNWGLKHENVQDLGIWIPDTKATNAGALASATGITVSAGGKAVATITQAQDTTSLQGSAAPSVTAVTTPSDGYASGDLAALLDESLAGRINEMMRRSLDCQDGRDFDRQNPPKKRASGTYGQAICAAEAVAANAVPEGPFNDLLLLNPTQLPFGFADAAGEVARAANVVADFVQAYGPMLIIAPELADQLAVFIFALAIDAVIDNISLKEKNPIKSSMVETGSRTATSATSATSTSSATTSSSGCPQPTSIVCGMDGEDCPMKMPEKDQTKPTCKEGKLKDCTCTPPPIVHIDLASSDTQHAMIYMSNLLSHISVPPPVVNHPDCPVKLTEVPMSVFSSDQNKVYGSFCQGWHSEQSSKMTVDSTGRNQNSKKRTPPPKAADYSNWNFDLGFTPSQGGGKCQTDCNGAYGQIASACGSDSDGVYIYEQGKFDVGCGTFDFKVYKPTTALKTFNQFCYQLSDVSYGGDVSKNSVSYYSGFACTGTALDAQKIKKDKKETFIQKYTEDSGTPYQYNVWWLDGCKLDDNGPTEAFAANPLMFKDPGATVCQDTLIGNWKNCNNKGIGGNIQVGCLIFEFKSDKNKRVF